MVGSGTLQQLRSTVTSNCLVSFDISCGVRGPGVSISPVPLQGGYSHPQAPSSERKLLCLPALVLPVITGLWGRRKKERKTTGCWSNNRVLSLASGLSVWAGESWSGGLEPAGSPGLQSVSQSHCKALGSSHNAIACYVRCFIINY